MNLSDVKIAIDSKFHPELRFTQQILLILFLSSILQSLKVFAELAALDVWVEV